MKQKYIGKLFYSVTACQVLSFLIFLVYVSAVSIQFPFLLLCSVRSYNSPMAVTS